MERLNRTLQTEWAYRQVITSNAQRTAALAPWLEHYNTQRRHSALKGDSYRLKNRDLGCVPTASTTDD